MQHSITTQERNWAAVAHASIVVTFLISIVSGGIFTLLGLLIPLGIYYSAPNKSRFVQSHALQALAFQITAVVGMIAAAIVGSMLLVFLWLVTVLLIVILVGLLLLPVSIVVTIAAVALYTVSPFAVACYGCWGAYKVWRGEHFEYRYVSNWVTDQFGEIDEVVSTDGMVFEA